ncbi:MAG: hypothetical protein AAF604_23725 [Acidobacteriota bacterium]
MKFQHRFRVDAGLATVVEFHRRPANLAAVTPGFIPMAYEGDPPQRLEPGDELTLKLWMGPLPVRWRLRTAELDEDGVEGFRDFQLEGPFAAWEHRHRYHVADAEDGGGTWIEDDIEARLADSWGRRLIGLQMWAGLPLLFAFRRRGTRRLLLSQGG